MIHVQYFDLRDVRSHAALPINCSLRLVATSV